MEVVGARNPIQVVADRADSVRLTVLPLLVQERRQWRRVGEGLHCEAIVHRASARGMGSLATYAGLF